MGEDRKRIFIISLDGATFDVINPLIAQGYMPNLGGLMKRSVSAELESVVPPVTAPAWSSFMTGKHPNKHGIFDFARFNPDRYNWTINTGRAIRSKTLWQILSDKNKRVIVLNLPYTYPPYEINGIMVSGWDAPLDGSSFSYPPEASKDVLKIYPTYKDNLWISELQPLQSTKELTELVRKLKTGFEQQTSIASHCMDKEQWDVFMVHFQQTDWIQHKIWTHIEKACKNAHDDTEEVKAARSCYQQFDHCIGRLLQQVEPLQPVIILLSDHGFGRLMGNLNPNFYLKEWGYLSVKTGSEDGLNLFKKRFRNSESRIIRGLYRSVARASTGFARTGTKKTHQSWTDNAGDVLGKRGAMWDWGKTRAAVIYAYQMGFVFVNVVGRGPQGIVEPGKEYEMVIEDLIARFKGLRHPQIREKVLMDVVRGSDIYPPADAGTSVPDLVLVPVEGYGFSFSLSDAPPRISDEGTHRKNGVLLVSGAGIGSPKAAFHPQLIDVAPTILHLLGLAVPSDVDGRVLTEIIVSEDSPKYEEVDNQIVPAINDTPIESSLILEQRLRGLGYLE